jgi:hypothetical protein
VKRRSRRQKATAFFPYNQNSGICWAVGGTFCGGAVEGALAGKRARCTRCHFYRRIRAEEWTAQPAHPVSEIYSTGRCAFTTTSTRITTTTTICIDALAVASCDDLEAYNQGSNAAAA